MIAFANADGGLLAIGIEDDGEITGIDSYTKNINEILRTGYDFCQPSIFIEKEIIECIDGKGTPNHILLIKIPQSGDIHANHRDEVYLRVGDKSKKLTFEERMELMYSKGVRFYEDEPVYRSSLDDIDMDFVAKYCEKIGYGKTAEEYIKQNKDYIVNAAGRQEMSGAAIMMFGREPQHFFPRSRVRFIRYEGTEAKVGAEMNVIKDKIFKGRILDLVEQTIEYVRTQIKEHTYLGPDARFVTEPEYPEFVWKEIIVNAITHRDYSIKGTDGGADKKLDSQWAPKGAKSTCIHRRKLMLH
jgi:ATP-dependent DNA helicase RecG